MGQRKNWELFIETTKAKAESHEKVAQYWHKVHTYMGLVLILLSAITTVLAAIKDTPKMATVGVSGVTTLMSAISGFLQPSNRQQIQSKSAKEFRSLSMRMIRCETDEKYERLWQDYNKELLKEPFLPKKYRKDMSEEYKYSMNPELEKIIAKKEEDLEVPDKDYKMTPQLAAAIDEKENKSVANGITS